MRHVSFLMILAVFSSQCIPSGVENDIWLLIVLDRYIKEGVDLEGP